MPDKVFGLEICYDWEGCSRTSAVVYRNYVDAEKAGVEYIVDDLKHWINMEPDNDTDRDFQKEVQIQVKKPFATLCNWYERHGNGHLRIFELEVR
jgi:hypothetical protein